MFTWRACFCHSLTVRSRPHRRGLRQTAPGGVVQARVGARLPLVAVGAAVMTAHFIAVEIFAPPHLGFVQGLPPLFPAKSLFGDRCGKLADLACPQAGTRSVQPLPDQREAADPVKEARHGSVPLVTGAQSFEHPFPWRQGDGVSQRRIAGTVTALPVELPGAGMASGSGRP